MTLSLLVFALVALVTLASGVRVLSAPDAKRASAGLAGVALGGAGVCVLMAAPTAALAAGACGVGASVVLTWGAASDGQRAKARAITRPHLIVGLASIAALLWIFAGTMARQYISYGVDLGRRPDFGDLASVGELAVARFAPALFGVALLAAVAVYALVAHLDLRGRAEAEGSTSKGGAR